MSTGILLFIIYLMFVPVQVMELTAPITVGTKEIQRGQPLVYTLPYCKYEDQTPHLTRELVATDGRKSRVLLPVVAGMLETGCRSEELIDPIPEYTPPGKYKLVIKRVYTSSRFYDVPSVFETEEFYVQ
jgi:hypothetical protein